jgi:hypothetical protein
MPVCELLHTSKGNETQQAVCRAAMAAFAKNWRPCLKKNPVLPLLAATIV